MNHRNNRRSEATKNKIKQTLIDMLHEQDISKITVQALCEKASINRSTFYNHYESPTSVLSNIEIDFAEGLKNHLLDDDFSNSNPQNLVPMLTKTLEYIQINQNICFLLRTPRLRPFFRRNVFRNIFNASLMKHPVFDKYEGDSLPYAQTFILYGCGHVIDLWLNGECKESPYEIATLLAGFISKL